MVSAFYERVGEDEFLATDASSSPWDRRLQHGGPVAALLATVAEKESGRGTMRVAQATTNFLGPMPLGRVLVHSTIVRPGRRIELVEATMATGERVFARAHVWRIRNEGSAAPPDASQPDLSGTSVQTEVPGLEGWGYGEAIEWRFLSGGFDTPGPADVWTRARLPLVRGEETSPIARALLVADAANGVSSERAFSRWLFIPPALTVTLSRYPAIEWIRLTAKSTYETDGIGLCTFTLADGAGDFAAGAQPLLVARR